MADRLSLYNEALRLIGERELGSLTENREPRRVLDNVWDDGAINACLEQGLWNFAMRTVEITYDPGVEPPFGYTRAFDKPADWIRTNAVCSDEFFHNPLIDHVEEVSYYFAHVDTIYVQYVSSDDEYGKDLSIWPQTFSKFAAMYLATEICERLTQNATKLERLEVRLRRRLVDARSKDAMNSPTKFPAEGSWVRSRRSYGNRRDRGNRGSLLG